MFEGMKYIYEVYKEKSFSKAARNLFIAQPSLSSCVKKEEHRLKVQLFDRSTTPVQLTEAGREYIKCAEQIMEIERGFRHYLNDLNELKIGSLAIGANNVFAAFVLPAIITKFTKRYPSVKVTLTEGNTKELGQLLFSGKLDFVIDNYPLNSDVYARHLFCEERLLLAVPKKFAINKAAVACQLSCNDIIAQKHLHSTVPAVKLDLFKNEPFVLLKKGNDTRTRAEQICEAANIRPHIILEPDQLATAYLSACTGIGLTFVSDTLAAQIKADEQMVYYKLNSPYAYRDVHFYNKHNKYLSRIMQEFLFLAIDSQRIK